MHTEITDSGQSLWPMRDRSLREARTHDSSHAELRLSLAREKALLEQAAEFEHRLFNSVQMIVSLLASQSRSASPEVAAQLMIAINRIVAFGHVHRRLHLLDRGRTVQFDQFLQQLCADLSRLVYVDPLAPAIVVESVELKLPTALGSQLGFVISELVTNAVKHGKGNIKVRLQSASRPRLSLSVSDDGPGLPRGFEPATSTGLGMKIVLALVNGIGGELHCSSGENGRGARFEVIFSSRVVDAEQADLVPLKESL